MDTYIDNLYVNSQHYGEVLISVMGLLFVSYLFKTCLLTSDKEDLCENIKNLEKRIESLEEELDDEEYEELDDEELEEEEYEEEEDDEDYEYEEEEYEDDEILKSYALNDGSHIYYFTEFDNDNIVIVYTGKCVLINCKRVVSIRDTSTDLNPGGNVMITYINPYGIKKSQVLEGTSEESKEIIKFLKPLL